MLFTSKNFLSLNFFQLLLSLILETTGLGKVEFLKSHFSCPISLNIKHVAPALAWLLVVFFIEIFKNFGSPSSFQHLSFFRLTFCLFFGCIAIVAKLHFASVCRNSNRMGKVPKPDRIGPGTQLMMNTAELTDNEQ